MSTSNQPQIPNALGDNSLSLGITSSTLNFLVLLISLVGRGSRIVQALGRLFFIVDGFGAFIGFLAIVLGFAGLFGKNLPRGSSATGLFLGLLGIGLFMVFVRVLR